MLIKYTIIVRRHENFISDFDIMTFDCDIPTPHLSNSTIKNISKNGYCSSMLDTGDGLIYINDMNKWFNALDLEYPKLKQQVKSRLRNRTLNDILG